MRIALIHATTTAVQPIEEAFSSLDPQVRLLHFMDTGLLPLIQNAKGLTPGIINRFSRLVSLAADSDVQCIQLTCSAFNEVTDILQPLYSAKLFRSDEAMLDEALEFNKVGLISTVNETPPALAGYLKRKKPDIEIRSAVNTEAIQFLFKGETGKHDMIVKEMIEGMEDKVEAIVLSQYSMAHIAKEVKGKVPVLAGPRASAQRCLTYIRSL
ncbi:MAG: aspartate/glutamate racemase family protein [Peptococcaceae bacterium]